MNKFPGIPLGLDAIPQQLRDYIFSIAKRHETTEYPLFKVDSFAIDMATASGSQAVTGVGFQPRCVLFIATSGAAGVFSIGFSDGTANRCVFDQHQVAANAYQATTSVAVAAVVSAVDAYTVSVTGMIADGFNIARIKTNAPTGTLTTYYLALR